MRWPWQRRSADVQLAVSWQDGVLAYVLARAGADQGHEILKAGVEIQGDEALPEFARRLESLGLRGHEVRVMLRPSQYQWLQIEAPGVAPEELRSAARYQIREMVDAHIDDVTIDVMRVGDGQHKGPAHLFVIAAPNAQVRGTAALAEALRWTVPVIDVQETAQRNLQNLLSQQEGIADRATAALVVGEGAQAVLTISANDELFYTRRLDIPPGFLGEDWSEAAMLDSGEAQGYTPVGEYVPDYGVGGESHGTDYSAGVLESPRTAADALQERAQRFVVEIQRSLDVWERSWSSLPLAAIRVQAGPRSAELARWLTRELGQGVVPMDLGSHFQGWPVQADASHAACWPLLGLLLRTELRRL